MYIYKTTAGERLTIKNNLGTVFPDIMRARRLLMNVLSDFFEDAEQKRISQCDAENIGDILHAVNELLWQSELIYSLTVGDELAGGCNAYYEGAKRALLVRDVERLRFKLSGEDTAPCVGLSDEEALPILQGIAKSKGIEI